MSAPRTHTPMNAGYDESLLAAAPEASKAARQEGYNVDLLDESRRARSTATPPAAGPPASRSKENYNTLTSPASPIDGGGLPRNVPFWKTRKGIIGLAILAIVIVGAVVGGAVGGTVSKSSNNNASGKGMQPVSGPAPSSNSSSGSKQSISAQSTAAVASAASGDSAKVSASTSTSTPAINIVSQNEATAK